MKVAPINPDLSEIEASPKAMSLLDEVLEGKSNEFQLKVLKWAYKTGVSEDDILFLFMVAIGQLELILEESPKDLSNLFESWSQMLFDRLKETERIAVKSQQTAIASAVDELIKKTAQKQSTRIFSSMLPAGGILALAISVGFLLGLTLPPWLQGGYTSRGDRLTVTEAETLQWAMSKDGIFARNLLKWNSGSLEKLNCLEDAQNLQVTLKVQGKEASYGHCLLWIVPFEQRRFIK